MMIHYIRKDKTNSLLDRDSNFQHVTRYIYLFFFLVLISCNSTKGSVMQNDAIHAIRLKPGEDLRSAIQKYVNDKQLSAGWVISCAGSLTDYNIRFANQPDGNKGSGHFEIVSLTGTLSVNGSHIHISISDSTGKTIGGHLLDSNFVYTTAEIIIQEDNGLVFTREKDGTTPWEELQIKKKD